MDVRTRLIKRVLRIFLAGWSDGSVEEQRARQEKSGKLFQTSRRRGQPGYLGGRCAGRVD